MLWSVTGTFQPECWWILVSWGQIVDFGQGGLELISASCARLCGEISLSGLVYSSACY